MRIYTVVYAPREHPLVASAVLTRVRFLIGREPNSCQSPFGSSGCVKSNGATLSRGRPPGWFRQVSPDESIQTSVDAGLWLMEWWDGETQTIGEHLYGTWQVGCQNVTVSDWDRLGPVERVPTWMKNGAKMLGGVHVWPILHPSFYCSHLMRSWWMVAQRK
jgi:hypothetical protein